MALDFIHIVRRTYHGDDSWGEMYIKTTDDKWEWLSYTYELLWKPDASGKSTSNISRVKIGTYALTVREDGDSRDIGGKGWRLQLKPTGHRNYIQIHRAHSSLYIEGCILPVHFNTLSGDSIQKGDIRIMNKSVELMEKIEERYDALKKNNKGDPSLTISAAMPAKLITNRSHAYG